MSANLTLAVDEQIVERAREVARRQGTSLNALIRAYLERLAGQKSGAEIRSELEQLWKAGSGHSGGKKVRREDIYRERLGRSRVR